MGYRGHSWAATGLMPQPLYLPFVVLFAPLWLGALSSTGMLVGGDVLMLPAMAGAMLLRPEEHTGCHQAARSRPHLAIHPVTRRKRGCGRGPRVDLKPSRRSHLARTNRPDRC
jgi:hypothetical protein